MRYSLIDNADFGLVEIVEGKPSCRVHGAMNKVSQVYWRCLWNFGSCRAGCREEE